MMIMLSGGALVVPFAQAAIRTAVDLSSALILVLMAFCSAAMATFFALTSCFLVAAISFTMGLSEILFVLCLLLPSFFAMGTFFLHRRSGGKQNELSPTFSLRIKSARSLVEQETPVKNRRIAVTTRYMEERLSGAGMIAKLCHEVLKSRLLAQKTELRMHRDIHNRAAPFHEASLQPIQRLFFVAERRIKHRPVIRIDIFPFALGALE